MYIVSRLTVLIVPLLSGGLARPPKGEKMLKRNMLNEPNRIDVSQTAINELANKPRQDITGQRYGNTLADDMFSIKNPSLPDRHTPESYDYFNEPPKVSADFLAPAAVWNESLPVLNNGLISRKKFVGGDSNPLEVYKDWGLTDDILEFPDNYSQEQLDWAEALRNDRENKQKIADLSTEGAREDKFYQNNGLDRDASMSSRRESEFDPYLNDELVNYQALSPATLEQLAKMGVNRPLEYNPYEVKEPNASDQLMELINAYKWAMENGYR